MNSQPMNTDTIAAMMQSGLPDARIDVHSEDNTHFEARVISPEFEGLRSLQRHQRVYATLGAYMGREIHALALKTYSPKEWEALESNAG